MSIRTVIVDDHAVVRSGLRLVLESEEDIEVVAEAADAEVVAAVREVASGQRYVHPALGARLVAAEAEERVRAEADPLSEREHEILRLLALGHTNQEIAGQLYLSVRTVETHRAHIMQKLRIQTRAELVRYALEQGMLDSSAE
jgi:two-component system response regulator NreC